MNILPHTLSLIVTHQCTAACDHCCFSCSPEIPKAKSIPYERLCTLIDDAAQLPSMKVIVFTGGECFMLGKKLDELIKRATKHGFITRCVTNGYWATSRNVAIQRVNELVNSGLKEINFSTGSNHAKYVPVDRIIHGSYASAKKGLTTIINAEIFKGSDFDVESISKNPDLIDLISKKNIILQRNVWMPFDGKSKIDHENKHSRFNPQNKDGCSTVLNVLAVTPEQHLIACCGLSLEYIPELHLGSIAHTTIKDLLDATPDDFFKIWIHIEGPERILEFAKKYIPDYELPENSVHPCQTCMHLYTDKRIKNVLQKHYKEVEKRITSLYMAGMASKVLTEKLLTISKSIYHTGEA